MPATDQKKPARRSLPALAAKPVAAKPVAAKPIAAKPVTTKAAAAKPVATTPVATKPAPRAPARTAHPVAQAKPAAAVKAEAPAAPAPAKPQPAARPVAAAAPVAAPPVAQARIPAPAPAPIPTPVLAPVLPDAAALAASVKAVLPPETLPKAVRGVADTGLAQARDAYATLKHSAETLSTSFGTSGEAAARGIKSLSATMLEHMQVNADATLGFLRAMAGVKSVSEAIELQARHARQQFETVTAQAKTLAGIVNRTASETAEPVRKAFDASIRRAS